MPTAAAVAAAAATAKIQAMDAVATNLGLKPADIMTSKSEQVSSLHHQTQSMTTSSSIAHAPLPSSLMQPPTQPPLPASSAVENSSTASGGGGYATVPPPGIMTFAPTSLGQSVAQPPPLPSGPPLPAMPPMGKKRALMPYDALTQNIY